MIESNETVSTVSKETMVFSAKKVVERMESDALFAKEFYKKYETPKGYAFPSWHWITVSDGQEVKNGMVMAKDGENYYCITSWIIPKSEWTPYKIEKEENV